LQWATGEYVAFLDDDDLFLPEKFQQQVQVMEANPHYGFTYAPVIAVYDNGHPQQQVPETLTNTFSGLFGDGAVPQVAGILTRRTYVDAVGRFDERYWHCADYDLWLRLGARFKFGYTSEAVGIYRQHAQNMSRDLTGLFQEVLEMLERVKDWRSLGVTSTARRHRLAALSYELARYYLHANQPARASRNFAKSIWWKPNIGLLVRDYGGCRAPSTPQRILRPYLGLCYSWVKGLAMSRVGSQCKPSGI
jgi:glycosyltransferase involved in cell wall biosynthesis